MGMRRNFWSPFAYTVVLLLPIVPVVPAAAQSVKQLQAQFDRETDSVRKAKLLVKLGDAQFEETRRAETMGDHDTVGFTLEKYRDNVRVAIDALKKQHPDAERHSNGYRQLEIHVGKGIREVEEAMLAAPVPYKPPLQIVRQDLVTMDQELIKLLFPKRPADQPPPTPPKEKQP
jgi:hypothetical protein